MLDPDALEPVPSGAASERPRFRRSHTYLVAAASGVTSLSFNFWYPFLPLYVLKLGADSDADALFWIAIATTSQGIARLASGPFWGVISDRMGRKVMFLRALYLSTLCVGVAAFATEPWHIAVALTLQGIFSGFNPAGVAFVSVSVPESELNPSLSILAGAQYLGTTIGPALGSVMAVALGYRGAILASTFLPLVAGTAVLLFAPRDIVASRSAARADEGGPVEEDEAEAYEPFRWTAQFAIAVFIYFLIFALNQLVRLATPIALRGIEGDEDVAAQAGLTFSLGGLVSVIGVLALTRQFGAGRMKRALALSCIAVAAGLALLAVAGSAAVFILGFLVVAFAVSAMSPASSTLVAANVSRSRRGTGFGIASSAQALSFMVGPAGAALFAAVSLSLGFAVLTAVMLVVGLLLFVVLREPNLEGA